MKQPALLLSVIFVVLFAGCRKLAFYGDTFYTVRGKIVDAANQPVANLPLVLYAVGAEFSLAPPGGTRQVRQLSANGMTGADGVFRLIFPKSNGQHALILENYQVIDSLEGSLCATCVEVDIKAARDYLIEIAPIRVGLP
ncbi:hypothetical protein [Parapedobacter sp. 2B3]|uniref:hypothetical protein n=1 Tax=Parapedobacter sp. 2B3 TaxID=3342381 RepID=UPI0035B63474